MHAPLPLSGRAIFLRLALIGVVLLVIVLALAYVGGWMTPNRLTAQRMVNQLQANAGVFPGYRRNHAKGVCVAGYFDSNGQAQTYSVAQVFAAGRTPVVGRFAVPVGNPYAPDSAVPIRSMALRFSQANGQQWRTGMNSMPVFPVATPQSFFEFLQAQQPDPSTGKPNPAKVGAFFAAHPETGAFLAWVKTAKPSASYVTEGYWSLNAFKFVDANGEQHAVRWRMVPEARDSTAGGADPNYLDADLTDRLAQGPQRWHLIVTLANPGDPTDDATKAWPSDRREIDAGTLVLTGTESQASGECRDINYDPTVLPHGIAISDDPLLPARSAAYATSYLRRTSEEAHLHGTATPNNQPEAK
ncbi:catalase family peroxidase [Dyella sp. 2HG41-7]|uniref:catalase family peroxidase n=1 Tax=Dyella sp. 2HG41-7 TaxID=2883239 RepID=UPI001F2278DC|nr:catalase family peroxidase [Dyella sp. 2HG41-7]